MLMSASRLRAASEGAPHDDDRGAHDLSAARLSELETLFSQRVEEAMLREARISQLQRAVDSARHQIAELEQAANSGAAHARDLEAQIDDLMREVGRLRADLTSSEAGSLELEAQLIELTAAVESRRVALTQMATERDALAVELRIVKKRPAYLLVDKISRALRKSGPLFWATRWLVRRLAR
jgi:chromosome segregation ATPase